MLELVVELLGFEEVFGSFELVVELLVVDDDVVLELVVELLGFDEVFGSFELVVELLLLDDDGLHFSSSMTHSSGSLFGQTIHVEYSQHGPT